MRDASKIGPGRLSRMRIKLVLLTTAIFAVTAPAMAQVVVSDVTQFYRVLEETDAKALLRDSGW